MKKFGIRSRFVVASLLVLMPLFVLNLMSFRHFYAALEENSKKYSVQIIQQVQNQLELLLAQADRLSIEFQSRRDVISALENGQTDSSGLLNQQIKVAAEEFYKSSGTHVEILLLNRDMRIEMSSYAPWLGKLRILSDQWRYRILSASGKRVITSVYLVSKDGARTNTKVMSLSRALLNERNETLGYVMIEMSLDSIKSLLGNIALGQDGYLISTDQENVILYHTNEELVGARYTPTEREYLNREYLYTHLESNYFGLRFIGVVPTSEFSASIAPLMRQLLLIACLVLCIDILIMLMLTYRITKPVKKLCTEMERVEQGDFAFQLPVTVGGEVGKLEQAFNTMLTKVDELFKAQEKNIAMKCEAQSKARMASIRPHFLYNALEKVQMAAYLNNDKQVVHLLTLLGSLLRESIGNNHEKVKVRSEVEYAELYLRFTDMIETENVTVDWEIDDDLLEIYVPHFILQPLIENALTHGIHHKVPSEGWIRVCVFSQKNDILISVEDNGVGMPEEKLQTLRQTIECQEEENQDGYLALKNIHQRVRGHYGAGYGIEMSNSIDGGFIVCVRCLKERGENRDEGCDCGG